MNYSLSDYHFLVVDDFSTMRRIVKNFLKKEGVINISEAVDGKEALKILQQKPIDFIVTDWNMPNVTGFELLQLVRGNPDFKHIPIIMVTAEAKREQIVLAAKNGVNGYIVKPFSHVQLADKIYKVFDRL